MKSGSPVNATNTPHGRREFSGARQGILRVSGVASHVTLEGGISSAPGVSSSLLLPRDAITYCCDRAFPIRLALRIGRVYSAKFPIRIGGARTHSSTGRAYRPCHFPASLFIDPLIGRLSAEILAREGAISAIGKVQISPQSQVPAPIAQRTHRKQLAISR